MRSGSLVTATVVLSLTAVTSPAQTSGVGLSPLQTGIACAPPPSLVLGARDAIRVVGAQDVEPRELLDPQDVLVLDAGTARGVAVGQEYFLRRVLTDVTVHGNPPRVVHTSGWVTVVAVNETTAIATVETACGPIMVGDYLEPFVAPNPPPDAQRVDTSGQFDFIAMGRVLYGNDGHHNSTVGDFVLIDQGADHGFTPGARVGLYRAPDTPSMPLVPIGEAAVMSVGPTMALVRLNAARGEVRTGDYVAPKR